MKDSKPAWVDILQPVTIDRTINSQLRFSVVQIKGDDTIHIAIREFAKYIKKEEKICGLRVEDMQYRATTNGLTFRVEILDEVVDVLNDIKRRI